ncbi:hypothetical protein, partial [Halorubrum sp. ASP1]
MTVNIDRAVVLSAVRDELGLVVLVVVDDLKNVPPGDQLASVTHVLERSARPVTDNLRRSLLRGLLATGTAGH